VKRAPAIAAGLFGPALIVLTGCSSLGAESASLSDPARLPGIALTLGSLKSKTGCTLSYSLFRPLVAGKDGNSRTLVIIGHGFLRSQRNMRDLAEAIAGEGVPVATIGFCNMRLWGSRQQQNGYDMIALASRLAPKVGASRTVYVGFSAGGLAALVAARNDPRSLGVVTLDLVDAQGLGIRAASDLDKPLIGLAGEPANCNAQGHARAVFAVSAGATLKQIPDAGHCDFEAPTDRLCELLCKAPDRFASSSTEASNKIPRRHIIASTTSAIAALIEGKPVQLTRPETLRNSH
jgi:pimeloyl-ACP methyl ester carboxylesterase